MELQETSTQFLNYANRYRYLALFTRFPIPDKFCFHFNLSTIHEYMILIKKLKYSAEECEGNKYY